MERTSVAIFGLGRIGTIHLENILINPKLELLYICDANKSHAESIAEKYALSARVLGLAEFDIAFSDKKLDGIIVGTPTDTHEELCTRAIEAGKHVLCEKPLAMTLKASIDVINLAKSKGKILLVAFNRRFDPQIRHVVENREKVGKIYTVKTCARDAPRPPTSYLKISGGIFHDCAVHDLDLLRFVTEEEPDTVWAIAHAHDEEIKAMDDVDTVFIQAKMPSGTLCHIELGRDARYGYDQGLELFGQLGKAVSGGQKITAWEYWNKDGQLTDCIEPSFKQRYHDAYVAEIDHFHALVQGLESEARVRPSDCLRVSVLAEACEHSWRSGQIVNVAQFTKDMLAKENISEELFNRALSS